MQAHPSEDDLVQRLAKLADEPAEPLDPTLMGISAEMDTLTDALRVAPEPNPFVAEPELSQALEKVAEFSSEPPTAGTAIEPASTNSPTALQPTLLGQYQLLEQLGAGGMGTVYRAVHSKMRRTVALKVLPADRFQSADAVARFEREIHAAGMLQHPNIVATYDAGEVDGRHFLVMELVEGIDLGQLLRRNCPLPIAEACEIVRQAALGLQHISDHGLVHRDIKPSNLMLAVPRKGVPTVKVLDLGLALLEPAHVDVARELTSTGQVMGTVDYMAPEQGLDTHRVDIRADLYSLGATLYKLLAGRAPFEDPQHNSVMKRLIALDRESPPPLSTLRPDCPNDLCELVHRLLAKLPQDRPDQPQIVAEQLGPFAGGADLSALLSGSVDSGWKPVVDRHAERSQRVDGPPPVNSPPAPPPRGKGWLAAAALPFVLLLGVTIFIATDNGQVTIEAPDDLKDAVSVSVLLNGTLVDKHWHIEPGPNNHRIQTGTVEVKLAAGMDDAFELQPIGDVLIKRGGEVKYRLSRRQSAPGMATAPPSNSDPKTAASGIVELPASGSLPEPPPLEEWLKGRTILTVAQDGSGQFKTIQAALDALQPGQAVKVLDRGPYRESLRAILPRDTGLISEVKTVLDVDEWPAAEHPQQLTALAGFRLHGVRFQARPREGYFHVLHISRSSGVVVENCSIGLANSEHVGPCGGLVFYFDQDHSSSPANWVRDCLFECTLGVSPEPNTRPVAPPMVIEHNFFLGASFAPYHIELQKLVMRHNVFDTPRTQALMSLGIVGVRGSLEILNNTVVPAKINAPTGFAFYEQAPPCNVVIRNNITDTSVICSDLTDADRVRLAPSWQSDHNTYLREHSKTFKSTSDVVGPTAFLSADPRHADAWRISADSPLSTAGAGETLPRYIGAFPPGPAPKNGDWFTRLQERWDDVKPKHVGDASPIHIPEPPPLEEWLKDRKVLTVAQDGRGQFKTIQAALDALQPGQVVKVLDKGPYRERLDVRSPPDDTGLVSDQQSIIELSEWRYDYDPAPIGHIVAFAHGFRLHGFVLTAAELPKSKNNLSYGLQFTQPEQFVLDQCSIQFPEAEGWGIAVGAAWWVPDSDTRLSVIRDCKFDGTIMLNSIGKGKIGIVHNWFRGTSQSHIRISDKNYDLVVIRENIFAGKPTTVDIALGLFEDNHIGSLIINNNTMLSSAMVDFTGFPPRGTLQIFNNLRQSPGLIKVSRNAASGLPLMVDKQQISHNAYPRQASLGEHLQPTEVSFPSVATDILFAPKFMAIDLKHRDYLRLPADSPLAVGGLGGDWPKYIGALPSGPAPADGDWFAELRARWPLEQ